MTGNDRPHCDVLDLGVMAYEEAWKLQDEIAAGIGRGERSSTLLLLEHPHVYTFGRKGHAENLLWGEEQLKARGVSVHWVDRGGDVTYHGPGQLVGYPLLPLGKLSTGPDTSPSASARIPEVDYVAYVRQLERTLIVALARLGIGAGQVPGLTGVWVQADVYSRCPSCRPEDRGKPAKLAAIGVKVDSHGVSRHGFALNVDPDMTYWEGIVACGLADTPVASLADLLAQPPTLQKVKDEVVRAFGEVFGFEMNLVIN